MRHAAHGDLGRRLTGRGPETGLTGDGVAQAKALAGELQPELIAAIYSSPRLRTRQTAAAIADCLGLEAQVEPLLDEIDFGEWTGRSFAELDGGAEWDRWNRERSTARCPGGESMAEAQSRIVQLVERLAERHDGEQVLLVTHCDMIRAMLCWHESRSLDTILQSDVGPASVTRLAIEAGARAAA